MEIQTRILESLLKMNAGEVVIQEFRSADRDLLNSFIKAVDESPYPIDEWLLAMCEFERWSRGRAHHATLLRMQEYLSCCIEGAKDPFGRVPLCALVLAYLESHGIQ